jgi:hypothetical protein
MLACALCLAGCAARQFTPVAMSQPGDEALSCDAIKAQIAANTESEAAWREKDKQVENANVAKAIVAPFAGGPNLSNEEQVEARALADRNEQLNYLAKRKGC